jgi:hypothetical protein
VQVGDRGRLPADLVAAYLAAHRRGSPAPVPASPPAAQPASDGVAISRTVHAKPRWDWAR